MLKRKPIAIHLADCSRSASSNTIIGDFPPNSSETFLRFEAEAAEAIVRPVAVEPVKATLLMPLCSEIALPTLEPKPFTTLTTPEGKPASIESSASFCAVSGVISAGFITMVLPAARAGATFQANIMIG